MGLKIRKKSSNTTTAFASHDIMESEGLLDNTDNHHVFTGAGRFADLTDHMDDADDSLQTKEQEQQSEATFFKKSAFGLFAYLTIGTIFYAYIRPLENTNVPLPGQNMTAAATWVDSLYFTMVTLTTVGYGDFHPKEGDVVSELFTCGKYFCNRKNIFYKPIIFNII